MSIFSKRKLPQNSSVSLVRKASENYNALVCIISLYLVLEDPENHNVLVIN